MKRRNGLVFVTCTALISSSFTSAYADGSAFVGGLVGGMLGSAITNSQQRPQRQVVIQERKVYRQAPRVNTYQREENRQVQTALNYFGFPAGVADGVMGRNSRAAVGQYQAYMGFPATGVLAAYEKSFLTSSYSRAMIGGPQNAQIMASGGQGTRGLLLAYRQEQMGVPAAAPQFQQPVPVAPAPPPATVQAAAPAVPAPVAPPVKVAAIAAPVPEPQPEPAGKMPSFLAGPAAPSIAAHCNTVSLATNSRGGYFTLASMDDPAKALDEQFCLARIYAIEQGQSLAETVQSFTAAEIAEQCEAFTPTMRQYAARLVTQSPAEVTAAVQGFVVETGAPAAQMSGNARICLGVGYSTDNADLAVASAMVLTGLGEAAYGELIAHHLMGGFGTPRRPDRGVQWLETSVAALQGGASPLVAVGSADRAALLSRALMSLNGASETETVQEAAAPGGLMFVLPTTEGSSN